MKKKYLFIILFPLIISCSGDDKPDLGIRYHTFLDKSDITVPSTGGYYEITAENTTIYISNISDIQGKDTIKTKFDIEDNQIINTNWYTIEVNSYIKEEGEREGVGLIKIFLEPLENVAERKLIILVGNRSIANTLTVSQY